MRRLTLFGCFGDRIAEVWTLSAGLFVVGPGHRADRSGYLQLVVFSGRRKKESDSSCLLKMPNQPWYVLRRHHDDPKDEILMFHNWAVTEKY